MLERSLIEYCSPTLAGLKTANLFNYSYDAVDRLVFDVEKSNEEMNKKGVYLKIMQIQGKKALLYVYRKKMLEKDLNCPRVQNLLAYYGYEEFAVEDCIKVLKSRLTGSQTFPHEIGVFLGYPLEDVIGFIANAGKNCKCSGCWKVYCNECEAMKAFEVFKKCREVYLKLFMEGKRSIIQLTVAA